MVLDFNRLILGLGVKSTVDFGSFHNHAWKTC
nr:MAG TPA: hypothetical protein [Caudoviricetes sp.]